MSLEYKWGQHPQLFFPVSGHAVNRCMFLGFWFIFSCDSVLFVQKQSNKDYIWLERCLTFCCVFTFKVKMCRWMEVKAVKRCEAFWSLRAVFSLKKKKSHNKSINDLWIKYTNISNEEREKHLDVTLQANAKLCQFLEAENHWSCLWFLQSKLTAPFQSIFRAESKSWHHW